MIHQRLFRIAAYGALPMLVLFTGCSRKPAPAGPAAPEVLVTTVTPKDVPRVLERVATLDGFINANIRKAASSKKAISFFKSIRGRSRLH